MDGRKKDTRLVLGQVLAGRSVFRMLVWNCSILPMLFLGASGACVFVSDRDPATGKKVTWYVG
jgi:hypothetical protein